MRSKYEILMIYHSISASLSGCEAVAAWGLLIHLRIFLSQLLVVPLWGARTCLSCCDTQLHFLCQSYREAAACGYPTHELSSSTSTQKEIAVPPLE